MNTITRGDVEKAQSNFRVALQMQHPNCGHIQTVEDSYVDIKEQFSIYA